MARVKAKDPGEAMALLVARRLVTAGVSVTLSLPGRKPFTKDALRGVEILEERY